MSLSFAPVTLDASHGDDRAMLVFRDDRLTAIVSCLGEAHGEVAGRWFVEAVFTDLDTIFDETFATLAEVAARFAPTAPDC